MKKNKLNELKKQNKRNKKINEKRKQKQTVYRRAIQARIRKKKRGMEIMNAMCS